ncbi:MAG TPA: TonB-dependent receptor [Caulobacteraceae bacterium]
MSSAAFAETAASNEPAATIGEVVVTAQFHEQNLQSTPLSITAMNSTALEARGLTNVAAIANGAPNVTLKPLGASFGPSLGASIRGIGQFDFNPALEPGVGIYVDDVYYPTLTGSDLDLLDLDRVEILRGPQGTLTGRNSIGGAIKLVSKLPDRSNSGFIEATYGTDHREELRGAANFAISDQLSVRISGTAKRQDGYVNRIDYGCAFPSSGIPAVQTSGRCLVAKDGGVNYSGLRASIRYRPNDRIDLVITGDYTHSDTTPPAEVLTYASLNNANTNPTSGVPYDSRFICGQYCNYAANAQPDGAWAGPVAAGYPLNATKGSDHDVFDGKGISASLKVDLSDSLNLQSITAHRQYTSTFNTDDDLSPANIGYGQNALNHTFTSEELRLNGKVGGRIKFTVGGFYSDQKTTYFTYQDIRYAPIPLQFVGNDPVPATSKALFGTVFWSPTEALNVTAGLRYTQEAKDYTFVRTNADGTFNPFLGSLTGQTGHYSGSHTDYRVSVDYRWNSSLMTYFTVSTGFKGGGISPRPFNVAQVLPFGIESLTAYEIGAKTDLFDKRVRFNASGFYNKYKDIQLTLLSCPQYGGPGPCAVLTNAGDADVKGVEFEANAIITDGWTVDAAASYLDFQFTRVAAATGLNLGDTLPFAPKWKWNIGTQYVFNLGKAGTLTPRVDVSFQDSVYTNAANGPLNYIPSYTTANAHITWNDPDIGVQATLEVTNLSNKYYYLTKFDLTGAGAGLVKAQPGRPREVAFTVKKTF